VASLLARNLGTFFAGSNAVSESLALSVVSEESFDSDSEPQESSLPLPEGTAAAAAPKQGPLGDTMPTCKLRFAVVPRVTWRDTILSPNLKCELRVAVSAATVSSLSGTNSTVSG
jgi:hypothetical protein